MNPALKNAREACKEMAAGIKTILTAPPAAENELQVSRESSVDAMKQRIIDGGLPADFFYSLVAYNQGARTLNSVAKELLAVMEKRARGR